jgi:hypothetical protein
MHALRKILVSVLALCASTAATASAADWQETGLTYNATATTPVEIRIGTTTIRCTTAAVTGVVTGNPPAGTNPYNNALSMAYVFNGCVTGTTSITISCAIGAFNTRTAPAAYAGPATAPANGGLTSGTFTGVSCRVTANGVPCVTITGVVNALHRNPDQSRMPNVVGDISYPGVGAGQAFVATAIGAGCIQVPAGTTTIAAPGSGGLLFKYDRPTGAAFQPYIWYG